MSGNSDEGKKSKPWYNLILHLHPRKVKQSTLSFTLTFGLGGMAALLVAIQVFTGLLLKFHYDPTPEGAYNSIQILQESLLSGKLARNIHHWSAILLLWITFFHVMRVLFTGAYRRPRQTTWLYGNVLLILVILSNFTGYLLPWDQLSYWAVTVSTSLLQYIPLIGNGIKEALLGGNEVNRATLTNFFNLHTGIIPLLIIVFMVHHFWRIRKAGGIIVTESEKDSPLVDTQPHLVFREFVVALVLIAVLLLLSTMFDAPLRERANPAFSPNPTKAPWYFMGVQELLLHFHPFFAIVIIPVILLAATLCLPYVKLNDTNYGTWFLSDKGKRAGIYSLIAGIVFTFLFILFSEFLPDPEILFPAVPSIITTGLVPFILVVGTAFSFLKYIQWKFSLNRSEYIQSVIILLISSYSVLSLAGILLRGAGMKLMWPWQL
jgi:quinol-cytochrome oxidoreductase complex cytochrome b subunit